MGEVLSRDWQWNLKWDQNAFERAMADLTADKAFAQQTGFTVVRRQGVSQDQDMPIAASWKHWELKADEGFFEAMDRGPQGIKIRVWLHGEIEFAMPEYASDFFSGDTMRYVATRLLEASMLCELVRAGWMIPYGKEVADGPDVR